MANIHITRRSDLSYFDQIPDGQITMEDLGGSAGTLAFSELLRVLLTMPGDLGAEALEHDVHPKVRDEILATMRQIRQYPDETRQQFVESALAANPFATRAELEQDFTDILGKAESWLSHDFGPEKVVSAGITLGVAGGSETRNYSYELPDFSLGSQTSVKTLDVTAQIKPSLSFDKRFGANWRGSTRLFGDFELGVGHQNVSDYDYNTGTVAENTITSAVAGVGGGASTSWRYLDVHANSFALSLTGSHKSYPQQLPYSLKSFTNFSGALSTAFRPVNPVLKAPDPRLPEAMLDLSVSHQRYAFSPYAEGYEPTRGNVSQLSGFWQLRKPGQAGARASTLFSDRRYDFSDEVALVDRYLAGFGQAVLPMGRQADFLAGAGGLVSRQDEVFTELDNSYYMPSAVLGVDLRLAPTLLADIQVLGGPAKSVGTLSGWHPAVMSQGDVLLNLPGFSIGAKYMLFYHGGELAFAGDALDPAGNYRRDMFSGSLSLGGNFALHPHFKIGSDFSLQGELAKGFREIESKSVSVGVSAALRLSPFANPHPPVWLVLEGSRRMSSSDYGSTILDTEGTAYALLVNNNSEDLRLGLNVSVETP